MKKEKIEKSTVGMWKLWLNIKKKRFLSKANGKREFFTLNL